jgi:DNA primase
MNLITALESDGCRLKRQSQKELAGACPWCGGSDRFIVTPTAGKRGDGRFWCRQCKRSGDVIDYLEHSRNISKKEAFTLAGLELPATDRRRPLPKSPPKPAGIQPKEYTRPDNIWKSRALDRIALSVMALQSDAGAGMRDYLTGKRGLTPETIDRAHLGYNPTDIYDPPESWNLEREKPVWIPAGLVIPYRFEHIKIKTFREKPRFAKVTGGYDAPIVLEGNPEIWLVTESELDGLLLHQEAADLVTVLALRGKDPSPDPETFHALKRARLILFNLDYDKAGIDAARLWMQTFRTVKAWPTPTEKDPGEYHAAGGNIRAWITAGIQPKEF